MADVDSVEFYSGVPGTIYLFLSWDVGMDNPRITFADCDGNGVPDSEDLAAGALDLDADGVLDTCQLLSADVGSISTTSGGVHAVDCCRSQHAATRQLVRHFGRDGIRLGQLLL